MISNSILIVLLILYNYSYPRYYAFYINMLVRK